jgi:acetylglutamate kinase
MKAEKLVSMTDVKGLLKEKDDEDSLIPRIGTGEIPGLIRDGVISGGMIPKIQCCVEGIQNGIKEVMIIDGRVEHSILTQLLTGEELGTLIFRS